MHMKSSGFSQNTREVYSCEPAECEEDELLAILVKLKLDSCKFVGVWRLICKKLSQLLNLFMLSASAFIPLCFLFIPLLEKRTTSDD